jgi:hypothetical protein
MQFQSSGPLATRYEVSSARVMRGCGLREGLSQLSLETSVGEPAVWLAPVSEKAGTELGPKR